MAKGSRGGKRAGAAKANVSNTESKETKLKRLMAEREAAYNKKSVAEKFKDDKTEAKFNGYENNSVLKQRIEKRRTEISEMKQEMKKASAAGKVKETAKIYKKIERRTMEVDTILRIARKEDNRF